MAFKYSHKSSTPELFVLAFIEPLKATEMALLMIYPFSTQEKKDHSNQ